MKKRHMKPAPSKTGRSAELEKLVRSATLTIHSKGSLVYLAERAGVSHAALTYAIRRGHFTIGMASAIESVVGRDVLSRELLLKQE